MKRFKILAVFAVMISAASLVSCSNGTEPLDPAINTNNGGGNGTLSGDYWPAAVNNEWTFSRNGIQQPPMKMIGTDNFAGATYYKFAPQGSGSAASATTWLNKNSGVYTLKTGDVNLNVGGLTGVQTGYSMVLLKDIAVGQTWTGTYNQTTTYSGIPPIQQTTNYTGSILEKDITMTVDGETYTNVIKMNMRQETSTSGSVSITNTEYWFAKNVGPIKTITYSSGGAYQSILTDYILF